MVAGGIRPDSAHDPGPASARGRADLLGDVAPGPIETATGTRVLVGTAGWTDRTLTASGVFYPRGISTPEERLRFYASRFPLVEVDATYYSLPTRGMAERWLERTPESFTFDVKAHALLTGHATEIKRLPPELRDAMPGSLAGRARVYAKDLPAELRDEIWRGFIDALEPLRSSGKLGAVLMQYPPWFGPGTRNREEIVAAQERFGDVPFSVELRNASWFAGRGAERTLQFFEDHGIPIVMVDEPQGMRSSVPPVEAVTSPRLALVRFHGRRADTWEARGAPVSQRYCYLYERAELEQWIPRIERVSSRAAETHVIMNNCYANYGTTNAAEISVLLRRVYGDGGAAA